MPEKEPLPPMPNAPFGLRGEPQGNIVHLRWSYLPGGQQVAPESFSIYDGASRESIDREDELDGIPYKAGQSFYERVAGRGSYVHGEVRVFAVVANGPAPDFAERLGDGYAWVTIVKTPPAALEDLELTAGEFV